MDKLHKLPDSISSEIFKGISSEQYADLLKLGREIKLQPKSILFRQGDLADCFFLVNLGRLKLSKLNGQGKEIILRYVDPGEVAAAITVLKNSTYPLTAESVEETEVTAWDKSKIIQLIHQYPDIAINLLSIILKRLDDVQERYLDVCTEHVDKRIARTLLRLMRRAGTKTCEGILIDGIVSRQNIADYSGTTLYTVSRTLSTWQKHGWIKPGRNHIIIMNPHALVQFAEGGESTPF